MRLGTVLGVTLLAASGLGSGTPPEYRLTSVQSRVTVDHAGARRRATSGAVAQGGDTVRTGWWGRATIAVEAMATRFEVHPSTTVRLGAAEPGVLVVLEKGKLLAIFDALLGNDERLVATPGAILAVRGTRYGLEVDSDGDAAMVVFAGVVEVLPRDGGGPPVRVEAGTRCTFGPRREVKVEPTPHGLDERGWARNGAAASGSGSSPRDPSGRPPRESPGGAEGGRPPSRPGGGRG